MYPVVCKIGLFTVYSYGLMLAVAFLVGSFLASKEAERQGIDSGVIFNLAFIVFISGIIGSRFLYIIQNLSYYLKNPLEMFMLQRGGLSWFGGLFLGIICASLYLKRQRLPIYKTLDLVIPFVALSQAIGRIGCLLNGCCFGLTLIPTQVYSSLILIIIFVILRFLQARAHPAGEIFFVYLLLYSLKRFFLEFFRQNNEIIFFGLTLFQILSILTFVIGTIGLLRCKNIQSKF